MPSDEAHLSPLIRRLESIAPVSDDERRAITALPIMVRELKADADIVRDHDRPSQCCAILEGFACRYKVLPEGRRQIMSFHIPGDIPDLQSLHLEIMDHSLATVVPTKVAFIPHEAVRMFLREQPRIADVFWRETLIDAAVFREWVVNVGRRDAYARIAHILCEIYVRLRAVGLVDGQAYQLPITQAELADSLISTPKSGRIVIEDWDRLPRGRRVRRHLPPYQESGLGGAAPGKDASRGA